MSFVCGTCWNAWPLRSSRNQHVQDKGHDFPEFECDTCSRYFRSRQALEQHMRDLDHSADSVSGSSQYSEYYCDIDHCDGLFNDIGELRDHEVEDHLYCDSCDRDFESLNSIRMHLNSKRHRGQNQPCPFCKALYVSASGFIDHLERGCCVNAPVDRMKIYEAIRRRDPNGFLTGKLLEWSTASNFEAASKLWNARAKSFECFLCGHLFNQLQSLNQHLRSPKHEQNLYHCPNTSCGRNFKTLTAITNHLESETCGFMRYEAVQKTAKQIFDPSRMIAF